MIKKLLCRLIKVGNLSSTPHLLSAVTIDKKVIVVEDD